jgi:hypothetical protein
LCEISNHLWFVWLATEYVEIGGVRLVGEVGGYQRGLDKLHHRITGNTFVFPEVDDLRFTEPTHLNEIAEFNNKLPNLIGVSNGVGVAVVNVYAGRNAPD